MSKILDKISMFLKKLMGCKPCRDIDELRSYIRVGDLYHLNFWVEQNCPWTPDKHPADEWKPVNVAITQSGDCEDRAIIIYNVINSWPKWKAFLMVVYGKKDDKPVAHAVCCFEKTNGEKGFIDADVYTFTRMTWFEISKQVRPWVERAYWAKENGERIGSV